MFFFVLDFWAQSKQCFCNLLMKLFSLIALEENRAGRLGNDVMLHQRWMFEIKLEEDNLH